MNKSLLLICSLLAVLFVFAGCGSDETAPEEATASQGENQSATDDNSQSATPPKTAMADGSAGGSTESLTPEQKAARYIVLSEQALKQGNAKVALEALTNAITVYPDAFAAYVKRADLLAKAKLYPAAIADLTRALDLPTGTQRTLNGGNGITVSIQRDDAKLLNTRGYLRLAIKDYEAAIADFDEAVARDLNYAQPYNNRGLIHLTLGAPAKAIADFESALRIEAAYTDAHNNLGYAFIQVKEYDKAIVALSNAIKTNGEYVNAWNNRGLAYKEAGRFDEAVADFTKAIELQPTQVKYFLHRKEAYEQLGQTEEAANDEAQVVWLKQLARHNQLVLAAPTESRRWYGRADHLIQRDEFEAAQKDIERAIKLDPDYAAAYTLRAKMYLKQGEVEQAIHEVTRAIATAPHFEAYSLRGDCHFLQENYELAVQDYTLARRLDDQVRVAHERCAEKMQADGKIQQASYHLDQASQLKDFPSGTESTDDQPVSDNRVQPIPTTVETP